MHSNSSNNNSNRQKQEPWAAAAQFSKKDFPFGAFAVFISDIDRRNHIEGKYSCSVHLSLFPLYLPYILH